MSGGEHFRFGIYSWDIDKAKEIIEKHPRKPIQTSVKNLMSTKMLVKINEEYAQSVDLKEPVILGWVYLEGQWYHILIDGNHRLHKAIQLKRKKLPAYLLTKEENYQILEGFEKERLHPEKTYISDYLKKQANKRPSRDTFYRRRIERFISQIPEDNWRQEAVNYQKIREELVLRDVPFEIEKNKFLALERLILRKNAWPQFQLIGFILEDNTQKLNLEPT